MTDKPSYRDWAKKILDVDKKTIDPEEKIVESPESYVANRILVVDDEEIIRMILEDILTRAGYEVIFASNGEEGIKMFQENSPALVITDIIMPEKEGLETIREMKRMHPELKIIAMSGGGKISADNYLETAKIFGASKILEKPFTQQRMVSAVKELIGD